VYVLSANPPEVEHELARLGEEIDSSTPDTTQVVLLDVTRGDGLSIKEFYGLTTFPTLMIVLDDDTVYQMWTYSMPRADEVSYAVHQVYGSMNE